MKRFFLQLAVFAGLWNPIIASASGVWKEVNTNSAPREVQLIHPDAFRVYTLDESTLKMQFQNLPTNPDAGEIISLPMPDGTTRDFKVWDAPMLPAELANKYPDIRTFAATAVDDQTVTAKLDFTLYGFHAMVFDGENVAFIDPYDNFHDGYYIGYYKKDLRNTESGRVKCEVRSDNEIDVPAERVQLSPSGLPKLAQKTVNGYQLRTYRLALACSDQYATNVCFPTTPTIPLVLSKMTTTMNRVNGVYEREFSLTMVFAANEDNIIFLTSAGDPFFAINSNAGSCLSENQTQCDNIIGSANYDIGHVFTTGSGGLASLGCVCNSGQKAHGTTGGTTLTGDAFNIDYVAHEMGHQFGSEHTFNDNANGSCAGNAVAYMSYEPGSGSTVMAYAGICDPDNVQSHSDPYFHSASVDKIYQYISSMSGSCSVNTPTGNKLVHYNAFSPTSYTIPYLTPFELTAPVATDSVGDSVILYCWEQYDKGGSDFGSTFAATTNAGPIFRSFNPSKYYVRSFPRMSAVLVGNLNTGYEKAPTVARSMKFRCLYRNIRNNKGCVTIPDEVITVNAVATSTSAGFKVTSQGTSGISYSGGTAQTITWDVVGSNAAPVNAANVDIYMSPNGGSSWNYFVGTFPNSGSASITVPNPAANTTSARFKVKGAGNVFFNVNSTNFEVVYNSSLPISLDGVQPMAAAVNDIKVFPVPAGNVLHITTTLATQATVFNAVGQQVWAGEVSGKSDIDVSGWAKGVYYIRFTRQGSSDRAVKQVVIQ